MGSIPNKIIVLGGAHHNGLGIIRSIGETGNLVYYISINSERNFVTKSKYIKKWWSTSEEDVIDLILSEFGGESCLPIILASDDLSAYILDSNYNRLKDRYIFPHIRSLEMKLSTLMNKEILNQLAKEHGFNVPTSILIDLSSNDQEVSNTIISNIGIPCVIKPVQSIEGEKSDILIIKDSKQLTELISQYRKKYTRLFVQQYINKIGEIGIQGLSMYNSKEVKIAGVVKKTRVSAISPGSTTYAVLDMEFDSDIENKIVAFIKCLQFCGIFDVEFMYDANSMYFIEVNFRNGAYGYAFTKAGVNLPYLWCKEAIGMNDHRIMKIEKTKILMNEFADFRNVIDKRISFLKWICEFINVDVYLILNHLDLKPFLYRFCFRKH